MSPTAESRWSARVYVKTRHPFLAYTPGDELAGVTGPTGAPLLLTLSAQTPNDVPQQVYDVGNHAGADVNGVTWPSDVRAVSVGDVIHITSPDIPTDPVGGWRSRPAGSPESPRRAMFGRSAEVTPPPDPQTRRCRRFPPAVHDPNPPPAPDAPDLWEDPAGSRRVQTVIRWLLEQ